MERLLSSAEMREADRYTQQEIGIPEIVLMEHAALASVRRLRSRFHSLLNSTEGVILAGVGNNGGDALASARILFQQGCRRLRVVLLGDENRMSLSTALQYKTILKLGIPVSAALSAKNLTLADWCLDGLFGTGLKRAPEGKFAEAISKINDVSHSLWTVSIDVPSGLSSDTGNPMKVAVRASETVALGFLKKGLVTGQAADFVGNLHLRSIQIPREVPHLTPSAFLFGRANAKLPPRRRAGHKGDHGHVFVFAGVKETEGASVLAALAALKSGGGLATLVIQPGQELRFSSPDIQVATFGKSLTEKMKRGVICLGPGFGKSESEWNVLEQVLSLDIPLVLDADAVTLLSSKKEGRALVRKRKEPTVLTPHPQEAARLLECSTEAVEADRYLSARKLQQWGDSHVVLKGRGTIVASPNSAQIVVRNGDSGLSKGGSGDVLTGLLGALLAQGLPPHRAIPLGVFIHGRASELLTQKMGTTRSHLASELCGMISSVFAELEGTR